MKLVVGDRIVSNHPDVAIVNRVLVVLKQNRHWVWPFGFTVACFVLELQLILDDDAVVQNGDIRFAELFAAGREFCCGKRNVVRLPPERWKAHVDVRGFKPIQRGAIVELKFQAERIENLNFVATLQIEPAVSAILSSSVRHVRDTEFAVNREILEKLFCFRTDLK